MNWYLATLLAINAILTIQTHYRRNTSEFLSKLNYLVLFALTIWVIYAQWVLYTDDTLTCKSKVHSILWWIPLLYSLIIYLAGLIFVLTLIGFLVAYVYQRCFQKSPATSHGINED